MLLLPVVTIVSAVVLAFPILMAATAIMPMMPAVSFQIDPAVMSDVVWAVSALIDAYTGRGREKTFDLYV